MEDDAMNKVRSLSERIASNIEQVIIGKAVAIENVIISLFCQGHILIEDVPGVGKTMLARSLARTIDCQFTRIQFTPDMLPADIVGVSVYNQKSRVFEYKPGPVMTQILLADEINRASPKTQSALLEAMEERQVTVDAVTRILPAPFMVLATQNPIEYEGTFPLPEAQLDRFMMKIQLGYPNEWDEVKVFEAQRLEHPIMKLEKICGTTEILEAGGLIRNVHASEGLKRYIVALIRATRRHDDVYLGASPRGSINLFRCSQARALLHGRDYMLPDDIKALAIPVLSHRLVINPSGRLKNIAAETIIDEILHSIPVPEETYQPE